MPAHLDGDAKNWLLIRKDEGEPPRPPRPTARCWPSLRRAPPTGEEWVYEVKCDGYRVIAAVERRRGNAAQPQRQRSDRALRAGGARAAGRAAERRLRARRRGVRARRATAAPSSRCSSTGRARSSSTLFDLLELDGDDADRPAARRAAGAARARRSIPASPRPALGRLRRRPRPARPGPAHGLEGVVAKRASSRYQPGKRSEAWVKVKTRSRQELVIAGYTLGQGRREGHSARSSWPCSAAVSSSTSGNCGTGFDDAELDRLMDCSSRSGATRCRSRWCRTCPGCGRPT